MTGNDQDPTLFQPIGAEGVIPQSKEASGRPGTLLPGTVLNHLYEIRRSIAKGGMGEVFEGVNVNYTRERVAIKVILPHLAADAAVQAMFFKEASTLTRLNHPAIVQYRTMAQEPVLGIFYIVTEFVNGPNLSDKLRDLMVDAKNLAMLAKRLAEGLAVAHSMGAIHRDISPDNILLEDGEFGKAKVIDFGIAKDLDPTAATIVGDGFAGKLNYVAPEQLGEFGREIGPWSDVYSLGLTLLAVARGRDVDMGGTIVDAVDKRRAGPDLTPVPDALRPLIAAMVVSNPAQRIRSMDEVVQWINQWQSGKTPAAAPGLKPPRAKWSLTELTLPISDRLKALNLPGALQQRRIQAIVGGSAVGLVLIFSLFLLLSGGNEASETTAAPVASKAPPVARPVASPVQLAQRALMNGMANLPCSWLSISSVEAGQGKAVAIGLHGVSGQTNTVIAQIEQLLKAANVNDAAIDYSKIDPIPDRFCAPISAFASFRSNGEIRLDTPQRKYEMEPLTGDLPSAVLGQLGSQAVVNIDIQGNAAKAALIGITEDGAIELVAPDLEQFPAQYLTKLGNGRYRLSLPSTYRGWSALVVVTGSSGFTPALFNNPPGALRPEWVGNVKAAAQQHGWKAEAIWYQAVDEQNTKAS